MQILPLVLLQCELLVAPVPWPLVSVCPIRGNLLLYPLASICLWGSRGGSVLAKRVCRPSSR